MVVTALAKPSSSKLPASRSSERLTSGIGATLAGSGRTGRRVLRQLKKYFVVPNHAQLRARPLLDRLEPLFEIPHLGVEHRVASLEFGVDVLLRLDLAIELPHPQPTAFAEPHRILEGEDECRKDEGEKSQGAVSSIGGTPRARDNWRRHRDLPRCAGAGCTSRSGPSATAIPF